MQHRRCGALGKRDPAFDTFGTGGSKQLSLQPSPVNQTRQQLPKENALLIETVEPSDTLFPHHSSVPEVSRRTGRAGSNSCKGFGGGEPLPPHRVYFGKVEEFPCYLQVSSASCGTLPRGNCMH